MKRTNITRPFIMFDEPDRAASCVFRLANLKKSYDDKFVFDKVQLDINRGDKVGVIGANGMGKSTLLKLLASVIEPTQGAIEVGQNVKIGYFPQEHHDIVNKKSTFRCLNGLEHETKALMTKKFEAA